MQLDDVDVWGYVDLLRSRKISTLVTVTFGSDCAMYFLKDGPWYGVKITDEEESSAIRACRDSLTNDRLRAFRSTFIEKAKWFDNKKDCIKYISSYVWITPKITSDRAVNFSSQCGSNGD